ncbi:alpha/beta hydrolase fold domain-containing protein [Streptomyces ardesiacus]
MSAGSDRRDVVVAAGSAGGGLSIATLLAAGAAGLPQPAAVVLFSP